MEKSNYAIKTNQLYKNFRSYKKKSGLKGSISTFFKRSYVERSAVNSFDLEIERGKIIGLLGPNGAGKTTLMKMFTGIIVPSKGELTVLGHRPWSREKEFRKKIALVMGQKSQLWWDIPAMDSLELLQKYYEVERVSFNKKVKKMSELLQVEHLLQIQIRKLSLGERMKMELMASLLHSPEILFLDEPTIGLDLIAQENIRKFIKDYHQKNNCTIILTSHYMADVQALCEDLVLIFNGEKKYDGNIHDFEKILGVEKNISFSFKKTPIFDQYLNQFDPKWNENKTNVSLRVPLEEVQQVGINVLQNHSPIEFNTEKMPIERVMKTLMEQPELLER
jgi:ABC-2 type transport system ATP-binding protein